jgi:c(7)-type cytochrome triheme protein
MGPTGTSRRILLLVLVPFIFSGCSDETLDFFFDIPPPSEAEKAAEAARAREKAAAEAKAARRAAAGDGQLPPEDEGEPPAIEAVKTWEQAAEMLPKDDMDQADWVAALEEGIVKPREAINGPRRGTTAFFKFDFFLPGPDPSFDAFFPHSAHTEWLVCESCHPKIFPRRGTEITMDEVFGGEYCGKCHGTVAFGLDACARCHPAME